MEMYTGAEHRATETYMIPGTGSNPNPMYLPQLEEIGYMGNEMAPEFIVDQGVYYPTANYYGYYSTGFESPSEWDDHSRFLGVDGQDVHYSGLQTESLPYAYYTPSYGYAQSPYNPYNPYIPGAVIGLDGPYAGTQQYFSSPPYQLPAYVPVVVQPGTDANPNSTLDPSLFSTGASMASSAHINTGGVKYSPPLSSERPASRNLTSETSQPSHASLVNVRNSSGLAQTTNQFSHGRVPFVQNPLKLTVPSNDGFTHFGSNVRGWATQDRFRPRSQLNGVANNATGGTDVLGEQNKGPRTSRSKGQWTSALANGAYASKVGSSNAQRNIVINADQYNRDDFPVNYPNAKFFVIKSYSEDDVHKSIKYNVWSSTPNGNKKLGNAYEDAQRISVGKPINCPIFLFFSVNASGQFCGVSEMIGPVDFQKDMDFWQQDKWTGSFPVKWHIIKDVPNTSFRHIILENNENKPVTNSRDTQEDVPNTSFRHIILENNENKPVTNSRDTQEILYLPGMNMLNIFKSSHLKTSILDDFMFYEERERIMQEEKFRILGRCYDSSHFLPAVVPVHKTDVTVVQPPKVDDEQSNGKVNELPKAYEKLVCGESDQPLIAGKKQPDGLIDQPTKTDGKRHNGTVNHPLKAAGKLPNGAVDQPLRTDGRPPNGAVDQPPGDGKPSDGTVDQPPIAVIKPANRTVDQPPKAHIVSTKPKDPKSTVDQPPRAGRSPGKPKDPKSMSVSPLKADTKDPKSTGDEHLRADINPGKPTDLKSTGKTGTNDEQVTHKSHSLKSSDDKNNASGSNSVMKIGSSSVDSKESEASSSGARVVESTPTDVVTVGSMRIKVSGLGESSPSSSIITVGDIPIEPKGLKLNKQGTSAGSRPHQK